MAVIPAVAGIADHPAEEAIPPQVVVGARLVVVGARPAEDILPVEDIPASPRNPARAHRSTFQRGVAEVRTPARNTRSGSLVAGRGRRRILIRNRF